MTATTAREDPPIRLRGVSKSFGSRRVLTELDLEVPRGKNLVIMGMSGTGKSVTLKIMAGLLRPEAGEVRVAGTDMARANRKELAVARERLGFLFQGGALIKWMSAVENVALPLLESGVPDREAKRRALEGLEAVGLSAEARKYPDELSGGMRKRVGFARAVVRDPEIILYDEPTTGLDPITKRTIDELIVRARDENGTTGVIVTHDMRSATRVADRIGLLYEGRLEFLGTPTEFLMSDHEVARQFARDSGPATGRIAP